MDENWLLSRVMMVIPLILSLTVHEWAHAYSAFKLGDDTALRMGRLTLNPIPHIDPIGTLLLPLMGVPFGWAKPVPVQPSRFRRDVSMRNGMMLTAAAGPASNVVLAFACVLTYMLLARFQPAWLDAQPAVQQLLVTGLGLNLALALFNMLPVPPLDGSRVADGLMPLRFRASWERFCQYGPILLLGVIFFGGSIISKPMAVARSAMIELAAAMVGLN
jgi:Zn-dependent protease